MRALVIDDSRPIRGILGRMLRELDFEITEACNGKEGLDRLAEMGHPDVATVNWHMPVLDGIEFLRAVRAQPRLDDLPVVMVSVESDPSNIAKAMAAGASHYVVKPFTRESLTKSLADLGLRVGARRRSGDRPTRQPRADSNLSSPRAPAASSPIVPPPGPSPAREGALKVLIVDDSVIIRRSLSKVLSGDPGLEVVGAAADGRIALESLRRAVPDVILLDVEMPNMDGLEMLRVVRKTHPQITVIMFSALTERGAAVTLDALMLGAKDYMPKPSNVDDFSVAERCIREELIPKIKQFGSPTSAGESVVAVRDPTVSADRRSSESPRPRATRGSKSSTGRIDVVVIGLSTGGPVALAELLPKFGSECPVPIVIVQHMPPVFTRHLAERLNSRGGLPVREASDGQVLETGKVYIAPGGYHAEVGWHRSQLRLALNQGPPVNSCRPSADVLFRSAAAACGPGTLAVIMTGMGKDGLDGCEEVVRAGGQVLAQDETSSVVWGMPGNVVRAGLADQVLSLDQLAGAIVRRMWKGRASPPAEVTQFTE
ncbi:MAG: chemotaxis-specific protein-glutamate methyltransferase CheB [Planctomycetes bacterium]|nr:chemotaxis-specific protein-glutamate methyltransferase CheB [Planctomycetota bacterium]